MPKYISAATPGWLQYQATYLSLKGPKNSNLILVRKLADGTNSETEVSRSVPSRKFWAAGEKRPKIKLIEEGIYYIDLDQAEMDTIKSYMNELVKAKGIIFDLRGYPNDNDEIIRHLLKANDTSQHWMSIPRYLYPDQHKMAGYELGGWELSKKEPHLSAKIVFLIDGRAISYAESFMGFIEHYDLATIVGQPTAGTNGNVNTFTLPGHYYINWTGMRVRKHDGKPLHGVGVLPDIYVEKTVKGVREGRDEFLEKAVEIIK